MKLSLALITLSSCQAAHEMLRHHRDLESDMRPQGSTESCPSGNVWEKKPCVDWSSISDAKKKWDVKDAKVPASEECMKTGGVSMTNGCCRDYSWLVMDSGCDFPYVPCICNQGTRPKSDFPGSGQINNFVFTEGGDLLNPNKPDVTEPALPAPEIETKAPVPAPTRPPVPAPTPPPTPPPTELVIPVFNHTANATYEVCSATDPTAQLVYVCNSAAMTPEPTEAVLVARDEGPF